MARIFSSLSTKALLVGLGLATSACTAILVPDADDDGVDRCNTTEDCPGTGDTRHQAACVFGAEQDENSDKVCSVVFNTEINCISSGFGMEHPYFEAWDDAQNNGAYNEPCADEDLGSEGCPSDQGSCNGDLERDEDSGTCFDPDKLLKAIRPTDEDDYEDGFEINDQICRYHFCDEAFVCNQNTGKCEMCEAGETMKNGGCVQVFLQGQPSSFYLDADHGECGDVKPGESQIGPAPSI